MAGHTRASDLVALIKHAFPGPATTGELNMVDDNYASEVALIGELASSIDPSVLAETFNSSELVLWSSTVSRITTQAKTWTAGGRGHLLARPGSQEPHPIVRLNLMAQRLPDQAKPVSTARLPFVKDKDLRENIARDIDSMERHLRENEWKSTMVLAGSVLEALLLDVLLQDEPAAKLSAAKLGLGSKNKDLERWALDDLIKVAEDLGKIGAAEREAADQARGYRNLIHPGRATRLGEVCTRGTARMAAGAVDRLIDKLS